MAYTAGSGAIIRIGVDGAQEAQQQINGVSKAMDQSGESASSLAKNFLAFAGPAAIATAAMGLLAKVIDTQRQFDVLNTSLITATGSAANAAQAFSALQSFAATTPYSLQEATKAFIQMRNLGLDPSEHALRSYGNTAAAMGKSLDQMIQAVADAATSEFERLKEFGIKAKQNGDQVALTFQGVTKVIGNNAKEIEGYLQKLGDTKFAGGMELRAATLDGAISNLGDTWSATMLKISNSGIGESRHANILSLTSALTDLNAILDVVNGAIDKEGKTAKESGLLHGALTTAFEAIAVLGTNVVYVFKQVGNELGGLAAQAVAIAHGDFASAKSIGEQMKADAEQARKDVDAKSEAIVGASSKAAKATADEAAAKAASGRDDLARYKTVQSAAEAAAEGERKHTEFLKKYATVQEQLNEEIKKEKKELGSTYTAEDEARIRKHYADKDTDANKEREAYASLISGIRAKIAENKLELEVAANATDSQKASIKLDQDLASGKLKLAAAHISAARAALAEQSATEVLLKLRATEKDVFDEIVKSTQARIASKDSLESEYALYGKSADAREIAMVAIKAEADLEKFLAGERKAGKTVTEAELGQLRIEKDLRVSVEQATLAQGKALGYAAQLATENRKSAADAIFDDQARAAAVLEIDADMWRERIRIAGEGTAAQKALQAEFDTWYANQLAKPKLEEQKQFWQSIDQTAHDTFVSIVDGGKDAATRLRDTFKNMFFDWLYSMTLKKWIVQIGASFTGTGGIASAAQAANGASALANGASLFSAAGTAITTAGTLFGSSAVASFGAGLASAEAGSSAAAIYASAAASGNLAAGASAGAAVGGGIASIGSSVTAALASIGPVGWAIIAAAAVAGVAAKFGRLDDATVTSTGLKGSFSGDAFAGQSVANMKEKSHSFWRGDNDYQTLSAVATPQQTALNDGFKAMTSTMSQLATTLGIGDAAVKNYSHAIDLTFTGDQTKDTVLVTAEFADMSNELATQLVPNIADFAKTSETASATLQRLGTDYVTLDASLNAIGTTFGAVGLGSVSAREHLIDLAGGLANLTAGASFFQQNFLNDAERLAPVVKSVGDQMAALGYVGVTTRDQFKDVVLTLVNSGALATDAGAKLYAGLMNVEQGFALIHPAIDQAAIDAKALADSQTAANTAIAAAIASSKEQHGLDIQLMTAMGNAEGALAATRSDALAALLSDGARATQVQIWAATDAATAIATAQATAATAAQAAAALSTQQHGLDIQLMTAMGNAEGALAAQRKDALAALLSDTARATQVQIWAADDGAAAIAKAQAFAAARLATTAAAYSGIGGALTSVIDKATSATQALRDFSASLLIGDLAPSSPGGQYAASKAALATASPENIQGAVTAFLQAAKAHDSTQLAYARDFATAQSSLQDAMGTENARISSAYAGVAAMSAALAAAGIDGSHANGLNFVPFNGYRAELHRGERVLTASENARYRGNDATGLTEEMKQMRIELRTALEAIAVNTRGTTKKLERIAPNDVLQTVVA